MITETFRKNIVWNLNQVTVQVGHAENVKGRAKSGYIKAAVVIAAAVTEALVYQLLNDNQHLAMPIEDLKCINSHPLPPEYKGENGEMLSICQRIRPKFELNKYTDLYRTNKICFDLGLYPKTIYEKVEKIRKLRKKLHIQGLEQVDRSYTTKELDLIGSVINYLIGKVNPQ